MGIFGKKQQPEPPRREVAAQRRLQSGLTGNERSSDYYRRNRTLASQKPQGESDRQLLHAGRKRQRRYAKWMAGLVVAAVIGIVFVAQIVISIDIQAENSISSKQQEKYSKVVADYFTKRPLERLMFLLDDAQLDAFVQERSPEVRSVRLSRGDSMFRGNLKMVFRKPVAQWQSGGKVSFVDEGGVVFGKNVFSAPVISVSDQSGIETVAGQEIVNRRFLSFLGQALAHFKQHNLEVSDVVLPEGSVRQVEFRIIDKPYAIRTTVDRSAGEQAGEAAKAIRFLSERGLSPGYIDVRVEQRVFYK